LTEAEYDKIVGILAASPLTPNLASQRDVERALLDKAPPAFEKLPTRAIRRSGPGEMQESWNRLGLCAAFKIESHNHPSFIEPFQAAATGVGGILRDISPWGHAHCVWTRCVSDHLNDPETVRANPAFWRRISGIAHYGTASASNRGGECVFESCYNGNPL